MDLKFQSTSCACLDGTVWEVQNTEQTQELRISDGMPDIGRVLSAWGQPILRSKEWHADEVVVSGGILVWVLYAPEDGTEPRSVDAWLPFQLRFDLPEGVPEGHIRVWMLPRLADARSVSSRKLMLRAGAGVMVQVLIPRELETWNASQVPEDVQLLQVRYPVRVNKEAGEKTFLLDEDLTLPGSVPQPEKLVYYGIQPEVTEQKVMGDKVVFRGNGNLHLVYRGEEGQVHNWDIPLPFSQYGELKGNASGDAQASVALCPTSLELELGEEGHLRLKCGMVGQYLVEDQELLALVEDAYSPNRELELQKNSQTLPVVLDSERVNLYGEQLLPVEANLAADIRFLPDFPRQVRTDTGIRVEAPGSFQTLYYDENSALQGASARWESSQQIPADEHVRIAAIPGPAPEPQLSLTENGMKLRCELPVQLNTTVRQEMDMVTGMELGELLEPDPGRPSLILHRAGEGSLWEMAKASGSTVEAIRKANGLQGEPEPDRMLLIPVL